MDTYGERLRMAIKARKAKQKEIAESVGITDVYLSMLISGKYEASERVTDSLCRQLRIRKAWLVSGEGNMEIDEDRVQQIARLTNKLLYDKPDSYRSRLMLALSELDDSEWDVLEKITDSLLK